MTRKVLDDLETAPIDAKLRATLRLLRQMTLEPQALTPEAIRAVLDLGVTREAVRQALHVAFLFNIYDRLADTLGWDVPVGPGYYQAAARRLLSRGYA